MAGVTGTRALKWVVLAAPAEASAGRLSGARLAGWLARRGHTVALVHAPVAPWEWRRAAWRMARESPLGFWRSERLFVFAPRTWLPVRGHWPFDGIAAWHATELLARPRASEILREAGFDHSDAVVLQWYGSSALVAQAQAPCMALVVDRSRVQVAREEGRTAVRKEKHLMQDADLVLGVTERTARRAQAAGAERIEQLEAPPARPEAQFAEIERRVRAVVGG
jgi:hypothetical protein